MYIVENKTLQHSHHGAHIISINKDENPIDTPIDAIRLITDKTRHATYDTNSV